MTGELDTTPYRRLGLAATYEEACRAYRPDNWDLLAAALSRPGTVGHDVRACRLAWAERLEAIRVGGGNG